MYRASIGMFNTYKFSRQKLISCPIYFIFWLILMLYHFFKIIFTVFNNFMHQRSFFIHIIFYFSVKFLYVTYKYPNLFVR